MAKTPKPDLDLAAAEATAAAMAEANRDDEIALLNSVAANTATSAQSDPGDETDAPPSSPDLAQAMATVPDLPGAFPTLELMLGHRARRAAWAPGYELMVAEAGGRSGARMRLMTTGSRGGPIEWKPQHLADELLAQDWLVVPAVEPMP